MLKWKTAVWGSLRQYYYITNKSFLWFKLSLLSRVACVCVCFPHGSELKVSALSRAQCGTFFCFFVFFASARPLTWEWEKIRGWETKIKKNISPRCYSGRQLYKVPCVNIITSSTSHFFDLNCICYRVLRVPHGSEVKVNALSRAQCGIFVLAPARPLAWERKKNPRMRNKK